MCVFSSPTALLIHVTDVLGISISDRTADSESRQSDKMLPEMIFQEAQPQHSILLIWTTWKATQHANLCNLLFSILALTKEAPIPIMQNSAVNF